MGRGFPGIEAALSWEMAGMEESRILCLPYQEK